MSIFQVLIDGLQDLQSTRYAHISALALMAWDHALTLDRELEYFWHGEWTAVRAIFFLNRYFPIAAQVVSVFGFTSTRVTERFCVSWLKGLLPSQALITWAVGDAIICHRLWSLYHDRRIVAVFAYCAFVAAIASVIVVFALVLPGDPILASPFPGINACFSSQNDNMLYAIFFGPLVFETIACILAMYKVYALARRMSGKSRLYYVLARDSLGYFLVILITYLIDMVIVKTAASTLREVFHGQVFALGSVSCSRMLLNLREVGAQRRAAQSTAHSDAIELARSPPARSHTRSFQFGDTHVTVAGAAASKLAEDDDLHSVLMHETRAIGLAH